MAHEITSNEKFVYIDGKKYPVELWGEKYGKEYGVDWSATNLSYYHRNTMKMLLKLNIVQYYQPPDGQDFTLILTRYFVSLCENYSKELVDKQFYWEDLLQWMAKEHRVRLGKKLLSSMASMITFIDKFGKKGQIWIK